MSNVNSSSQIAHLNDTLRTTFLGGSLVLTTGMQALPEEDQVGILHAVRIFDTFTPDNDPHGEHDFGRIEYKGYRIFWKIDYYDPTLTFGSENPADPSQTNRVLTVMLAEEY